jgi:hypothetical protein
VAATVVLDYLISQHRRNALRGCCCKYDMHLISAFQGGVLRHLAIRAGSTSIHPTGYSLRTSSIYLPALLALPLDYKKKNRTLPCRPVPSRPQPAEARASLHPIPPACRCLREPFIKLVSSHPTSRRYANNLPSPIGHRHASSPDAQIFALYHEQHFRLPILYLYSD